MAEGGSMTVGGSMAAGGSMDEGGSMPAGITAPAEDSSGVHGRDGRSSWGRSGGTLDTERGVAAAREGFKESATLSGLVLLMPPIRSSPAFQRLTAGYRRLRGGQLSPGRFAASVALGLFIGCLPLYGAHFFLCAGLGMALRLDVLISYAAANISIPPMIPLLLFSSAQLGSLILRGEWLHLSFEEFRVQELAKIGVALGVGSVVLGGLVASMGGMLAFLAARWFARVAGEAEGPFADAVARAIQRYQHVSTFHRRYVYFKLKIDPLTRQLFTLCHQRSDWGRVIDAGAGRGQFSLFLYELGVVSSLLGFDHDAEKIEVARIASADLEQVGYRLGDLCQEQLAPADTILLFDVLHYLPVAEQRRLLERVAAGLPPHGVLLLRENNRGSGLGSWLARGFEWLARWLGINRGSGLRFWSPAEISAFLREQGLEVSQPTPELPGQRSPSNVLLLATRTASAEAISSPERNDRWMRSAVSSSVGS